MFDRLKFVLFSFLFCFSSNNVLASSIDFVVAEKPGYELLNDSYIITLTDPSDIVHARDLINYGPGIGGALIVADIAVGSDGKNRNAIHPLEPLWSWHVTGFQGFGDFTIGILDGSPTFVENNLNWWMQNTGGSIGFWNYTVVSEIESSAVPLPGAVWLLLSGMMALVSITRIKKHKYDN